MPDPIRFDRIADLYDSYVTVDFDIPFFLEEAKKIRGKVLELTCGTGRVSLPLLRAGINLTCVDYSGEMLAILRRRLERSGLSCDMHQMDIAELSLPDHYDLIFIPFHSFSEIVDKSRQRKALERIHAHLIESGTFICTLQNPPVRTRTIDGSLRLVGEFPNDSGGSLVVRSRLNYDETTHLASGKQFHEVYDDRKTLQRSVDLDVHFYLFAKHEFEEIIRETGFQVEDLYGDYSYSPFDPETSQFMVWRLRKRGA